MSNKNVQEAVTKKKGPQKKHWIQGAIKHKGALTKKANKAGESPMEFARSHENSKGTTGKQSRLAVELYNMHNKG